MSQEKTKLPRRHKDRAIYYFHMYFICLALGMCIKFWSTSLFARWESFLPSTPVHNVQNVCECIQNWLLLLFMMDASCDVECSLMCSRYITLQDCSNDHGSIWWWRQGKLDLHGLEFAIWKPKKGQLWPAILAAITQITTMVLITQYSIITLTPLALGQQGHQRATFLIWAEIFSAKLHLLAFIN